MEYLFFIGILCLAFFTTVFLLCFYARKNTSWVAYIAAFSGWYTSFVLVGILPYDIYLVSFIYVDT